MKKPSLKKIKKTAKTTVIASVASASIIVGGLFSSPGELMLPDGSTPTAVIQMVDTSEDDGGDTALLSEPEERRRGVRARLRLWILQLPPWLRAMVGVPLWCGGFLIISVLTALWSTVLSPVASGLLEFLCIAALLAAVLCAVLKAAFPDIPLKDILNRRSVSILLIGLALIGVSGTALDVFYPEGEELAQLMRWLGAAALLLTAALPVLVKQIKAREAVHQ